MLPFLAAVIAALRLSSLPDLIRQSMLSGSSAWTTGSQTSEAAPFERLSPVVTRTQDRHPSISGFCQVSGNEVTAKSEVISKQLSDIILDIYFRVKLLRWVVQEA